MGLNNRTSAEGKGLLCPPAHRRPHAGVPSGKAALAADPRAVLGSALLPGRTGAPACSQPSHTGQRGTVLHSRLWLTQQRCLWLSAPPGALEKGERSPLSLAGLGALGLMGIKTAKA